MNEVVVFKINRINMKKIALALVSTMVLLAAQDGKPADPPKKTAKDQQELDLITAIGKETDLNKKLQTLDKWSQAYPQTELANERQAEYLATYQALNKPREAVNMANEILKRDPNDFTALRAILINVFLIANPPPAADLDTAEKVANHFVNDADAIFVDANKPAYMTPQQWTDSKQPMRAFSQLRIGVIYQLRKDNERAEVEFGKALQMTPNDSQIAQALATVILAQNKTKPEKQPLALFYYARAAAYDGPGSLPAANRQQLQTFLGRAYNTYHGSAEGLDKLLALAKANATPPADFHIDSTKDIADAKNKADEEARRKNPMLALWTDLKTGLTGSDPDGFFNASVKEVGLPKFKGTLVSAKPETRPKELVIAVEKPGVGDCTLKLDEGQFLPGKMDPGGEIEFEGVGTAYTKDPYMLVLTVDKAKITGWTGKNVAPVKKAPPAKKKAQ